MNCPSPIKPGRTYEQGSALILIFIAVALFGALSFAVSQMLRQGNPQVISQEKARIYAQETLTYAGALREAVHSVRISNACADTEVSFDSADTFMEDYEHTPAARDACRIYSAEGAGMAYVAPQEDWLDQLQGDEDLYGKIYIAGNVCVPGVGTGDDDSCDSDSIDDEELVLFIPFMRREVCMEINELLGHTGPSTAPPQEDGDAWDGAPTLFTGAYDDEISLDQDGKMNGCFKGDGDPAAGSFAFFQVLLAR